MAPHELEGEAEEEDGRRRGGDGRLRLGHVGVGCVENLCALVAALPMYI